MSDRIFNGGFMDYSNQQGAARAAQVGCVMTTTSLAPPQRPRLDQCNEYLEQGLMQFSKVISQLEAAADRIIGSQPESSEKEPNQPIPSSAVAHVEMHAHNLGRLVDRLQRAVERFESL